LFNDLPKETEYLIDIKKELSWEGDDLSLDVQLVYDISELQNFCYSFTKLLTSSKLLTKYTPGLKTPISTICPFILFPIIGISAKLFNIE